MAARAAKPKGRLSSIRKHDGPAAADRAAAPNGAPADATDVAAAMHYRTGDVIADKYKLESIIGRGGMGSVWRARNLVLNVAVAIKLINRQVASEEAGKRLLIEARSAAQLGHPSIVRVHDFGTTERDDPYIVMEFLQGEALGDIIDRKGRLDPVASVRLALPVLAALSAAHGKGIVHRDLKPDNIILETDDNGNTTPKLVDFGIAQIGLESLPQDEPSDDGEQDELEQAGRLARRLTQTGRIVGSPDYMSPEQARGDEVDERSDLWSMAVVLYETMTGCMPFSGDRVDKLLIDVLVGKPPPITTLDVGDDSLWQILERALAKRKERRWQDAREMGQALATWLLSQGVDTDIAGASVRQHWLEATTARPLSLPPPSRNTGLAADGDPHGTRATPPLQDAVSLLEIGKRGEVSKLGAAHQAATGAARPVEESRKRALVAAIVALPTMLLVGFFLLRTPTLSPPSVGADGSAETSTIEQAHRSSLSSSSSEDVTALPLPTAGATEATAAAAPAPHSSTVQSQSRSPTPLPPTRGVPSLPPPRPTPPTKPPATSGTGAPIPDVPNF